MNGVIIIVGILLTIVGGICWVMYTNAQVPITRKGMLAIGNAAPDFTLSDQQGALHSLSDFKGSNVALYFYPKNNTPGCTQQACSIRDGFSQLRQSNIQVIGISYDTPQSHAAFADNYALPFLLLSDIDKKVSKMYGVKGLFFIKRTTFLINTEGVLIDCIRNVDVADHAQQIIAAFKK